MTRAPCFLATTAITATHPTRAWAHGLLSSKQSIPPAAAPTAMPATMPVLKLLPPPSVIAAVAAGCVRLVNRREVVLELGPTDITTWGVAKSCKSALRTSVREAPGCSCRYCAATPAATAAAPMALQGEEEASILVRAAGAERYS